MSSTTKKHDNFVRQPMGSKGVMAIPGIGEKFAKRLENRGYHQASQVYGQYLVMGRDEEKFCDWLSDIRFMNVRHQMAVVNALNEYSNHFSN